MSAADTPQGQRVLLLDVMGTLVYDPFYAEMPAFFDMTLEQLIAEKDPGAWPEYERGEIDGRVFLDRFFRDRRDYDREGLLECMRSSYRWLEGIPELLSELAGRGTRMVALSNYSDWYRMIEDELGLSRFLSWDLVSCHTGHRKPEPAAYRHALASLGVEADRCLFVDDRDENCRAARELGIDSVLFRGAQELRSELDARGV